MTFGVSDVSYRSFELSNKSYLKMKLFLYKYKPSMVAKLHRTTEVDYRHVWTIIVQRKINEVDSMPWTCVTTT